MKKSTMIAALFAASAFSAFAADVYSSNVVGYNKVDLSTGYSMLGVQFSEVSSPDISVGTVALLDSSFAGFDENLEFANEMRVWNGNGYTTYGWSGTSYSDFLGSEYAAYDNQWLDAATAEPTTNNFVVGQAFWVKTATSGQITFSGEVANTNTVTYSLVAGFNMVANPFPTPLDLSVSNGVLDSSFAGFDENLEFATEMRVWNGNGYTTYGWSGTSYSDFLGSEYAAYDNLWLDAATAEPSTNTIPVGGAFWIKAANSGEITFTR